MVTTSLQNLPLHEKYRPREWSEVIGQDDALQKLSVIRDRSGLAGKSYFISGKSGTGKTTIARLIAAEVAGEGFTFEYSDPSELDAGTIDFMRRQIALRPLGRGFCFIVNEIHGASDALCRKLLGLTEAACPWVTFVFTTTTAGKDLFGDCLDSRPLLSRCVRLELSERGLADVFAKRCLEIARAENLDGRPLEQYKRLLMDQRNNMRAALSAVEAGEMLA